MIGLRSLRLLRQVQPTHKRIEPAVRLDKMSHEQQQAFWRRAPLLQTWRDGRVS